MKVDLFACEQNIISFERLSWKEDKVNEICRNKHVEVMTRILSVVVTMYLFLFIRQTFWVFHLNSYGTVFF